MQRQTMGLSIQAAIKLFQRGFSGDPKELQQFIDNVEAAHTLVSEDGHPILLKHVLASITNPAKQIIQITPNEDWQVVKEKLKAHYRVTRTLPYYMAQFSQMKQKQNETVSQWGTRVEEMISKALDSAAVINERWEAGTKTGQTRTIMLLGQTCFVNGLSDERIRTQMSVFMNTQPTMEETVDKALICETNVKSQAIQPQVRK
jgi:Retrotransposon gag protein.